MKKWMTILGLLLSMMLCLMLGACGDSTSETAVTVYYLNLDATMISPEEFETAGTSFDDDAQMYLYALTQDPDNSDLRRTLPDTIRVQGYERRDYLLTVDFSEGYYDLPVTDETLIRAAFVRTLTQVEGVSFVAFTVEGQPLVNARGENVGMMSAESFVENPDAAINTSQETRLTLYFSSPDGTYLIPEVQKVYYSSNETLAKVIVQKLIQGPTSSDTIMTLPSNTNIITVSVMDGVCYVNFDSNFSNQNQEITEGTVLYSIVNSLTELPDIEKVQLSINGDTSGKCRYTYDLSNMYERDESFFQPPVAGETSTEEILP